MQTTCVPARERGGTLAGLECRTYREYGPGRRVDLEIAPAGLGMRWPRLGGRSVGPSREHRKLHGGDPWLSIIAEARDSLWSVDLFRCESVMLKSFWVMVVIDVFTRRIVEFGVEPAHIDGISVCRMFNRARRGQPLPKRRSSDHDPLFRFHRWREFWTSRN